MEEWNQKPIENVDSFLIFQIFLVVDVDDDIMAYVSKHMASEEDKYQ